MFVGVGTLNALDSLTEKDSLITLTQFKKCYETFASYLIERMPLDNVLIKDAQYLHPLPKFRLSDKSTAAIRRLALIVGNVLKSKLKASFKLTQEISPDQFPDLIINQWHKYQNESIDESWYRDNETERFIPINLFWNKVSKIEDIDGKFMFTSLCKLLFTFLSISHGNATPERGFSLNKFVLDDRTSLSEDVLISLRIIKDQLKCSEDIIEFKVTSRLMELVKI